MLNRIYTGLKTTFGRRVACAARDVAGVEESPAVLRGMIAIVAHRLCQLSAMLSLIWKVSPPADGVGVDSIACRLCSMEVVLSARMTGGRTERSTSALTISVGES
jgi:hypothetical protein